MKLIFTNQYAELLLLANGLLLVFYLGAKKKKRQRAMKFGNYETLQKVAGRNFLKSSNIILVTRILALTALIIGISSPVLQEEVPSTDTDYVLAIDSSGSMLSSDLDPTRFRAAKQTSEDFVNSLSNTTSVGVISFGGEVNRESDLSRQKQQVIQSIQEIETGSTAGTAIGDAIYSGSSMLSGSNRSRSLLLITDGRNNVGGSINDSVEFADAQNVTVHVMAIGDSNSSTDQEDYGIVDGVNASRADFPNLDTQNLYRATNATGGELVTVSETSSLEDAFLDFQDSKVETDISSYFLFAAVALLILEWVLGTTRFSILP